MFGAERQLVLSGLVFIGMMVMSDVGSPTTWIIGLVLFGGMLMGLQKLAARDPRFSEVYRRQLTYNDYYPATRGVDAPHHIPVRK
jgi:type IV secretory pathway TrbD component